MSFWLWLKCMFRGGHNPDTLIILRADRGFICDGMVPVTIYDCECASCGAQVQKTTPRLPGA
jgi:hypothetical protein